MVFAIEPLQPLAPRALSPQTVLLLRQVLNIGTRGCPTMRRHYAGPFCVPPRSPLAMTVIHNMYPPRVDDQVGAGKRAVNVSVRCRICG